MSINNGLFCARKPALAITVYLNANSLTFLLGKGGGLVVD